MDQIRALCRFQHRSVDVCSVNHGIRILEAIAKSLPNWKAANLRAIDRIHHDEPFGKHSPLACGFAHA